VKETFSTILVGYILGSISFGILTGKFLKGIDIRKYGSGNAGVTNVYRTLGKVPAIFVLAGDLLKGIVAAEIGLHLGGINLGMVGGFAAVVGHIYPLFFGFRGGKGSATGFGAALVLAPDIMLIAGFTFIMTVILTRYVSLGSILGGVVSIIFVFVWHKPFPMQIFIVFLSLFVIYRHRTNLVRLYRGEENKIKFNSK